MPLERLQRLLASALSDPRGDTPPALLAAIADHGLAGEARLDIYRANTVGSLTRALDRAYPVCRQILGERYFARLARDHALRSTPTDPDLDTYGGDFDTFLTAAVADRPELSDYGYLPDLARLEWAVKQAWLAPDGAPFDFTGFRDSLAGVPAERHRLQPAPSLRLLVSEWPVDRLWSLHRHGEAPGALAAEGTVRLCIVRNDHEVTPRRIDAGAADVLGGVLAGATLGELGERAAARGVDLHAVLPIMIGDGWICGYEVPDSGDR